MSRESIARSGSTPAKRLRSAGYRLREKEVGWEEFSRLRSTYAAWLNQTTKYMGVPPAPWIGDRSYLPHRERGHGGRRRGLAVGRGRAGQVGAGAVLGQGRSSSS